MIPNPENFQFLIDKYYNSLFAEDNSKNKRETLEDASQREDSIKSQPTPAILRVSSINSSHSRKDQSDHDQVCLKNLTKIPIM